jgi:hypothetical protein
MELLDTFPMVLSCHFSYETTLTSLDYLDLCCFWDYLGTQGISLPHYTQHPIAPYTTPYWAIKITSDSCFENGWLVRVTKFILRDTFVLGITHFGCQVKKCPYSQICLLKYRLFFNCSHISKIRQKSSLNPFPSPDSSIGRPNWKKVKIKSAVILIVPSHFNHKNMGIYTFSAIVYL